MTWTAITAPPGLRARQPMVVRVRSIPARHYFPEHAHGWAQLVYAITGVLTVAVEGRSFAISPEQAVWLPAGLTHRVGSLLGAEFRSLWIADEVGADLPAAPAPAVIAVGSLLRALIVEAAAIGAQDDGDGYAGRIAELMGRPGGDADDNGFGYGSTSAFIYAFCVGMGQSPQAYMRRGR